jgi:hypothetical protein
LETGSLSPKALAVALFVTNRINSDSGSFKLSRDYVAEKLRISHHLAGTALLELIEAGVLVATRKGRRSARVYSLGVVCSPLCPSRETHLTETERKALKGVESHWRETLDRNSRAFRQEGIVTPEESESPKLLATEASESPMLLATNRDSFKANKDNHYDEQASSGSSSSTSLEVSEVSTLTDKERKLLAAIRLGLGEVLGTRQELAGHGELARALDRDSLEVLERAQDLGELYVTNREKMPQYLLAIARNNPSRLVPRKTSSPAKADPAEIEELRELEQLDRALSSPPPLCPHGKTLARCVPCCAEKARNFSEGEPLAEDWQPSPELAEELEPLGLELDREVVSFRDYWICREIPELAEDWGDRFRSWCSRLANNPRAPWGY